MSKLYFFYGAMNAGKSALLLQNNHNYVSLGMKTLLYIPEITKTDFISSRTGLKERATPFNDSYLFNDIPDDINAIFIDESQFLSKKQVISLCKLVDYHNVQVYCYGIRSDFRGEMFEGVKYLMTLSDVITEIKNVCRCGRKATMNSRIISNPEQVELNKNVYQSMCRKCFYEDNPLI